MKRLLRHGLQALAMSVLVISSQQLYADDAIMSGTGVIVATDSATEWHFDAAFATRYLSRSGESEFFDQHAAVVHVTPEGQLRWIPELSLPGPEASEAEALERVFVRARFANTWVADLLSGEMVKRLPLDKAAKQRVQVKQVYVEALNWDPQRIRAEFGIGYRRTEVDYFIRIGATGTRYYSYEEFEAALVEVLRKEYQSDCEDCRGPKPPPPPTPEELQKFRDGQLTPEREAEIRDILTPFEITVSLPGVQLKTDGPSIVRYPNLPGVIAQDMLNQEHERLKEALESLKQDLDGGLLSWWRRFWQNFKNHHPKWVQHAQP